MSDWANIATIIKADKSNPGGLFVRSAKESPFCLSEGLAISFVPPVLHVPRTGTITSLVRHGQNNVWIAVSGIDSLEYAEALIGHYCLAKKADLSVSARTDLSTQIMGYSVFDHRRGYIGKVRLVESNPAHPLLVVSSDADCAVTEIRIPYVKEFILQNNANTQELILDIPEGLLEIQK